MYQGIRAYEGNKPYMFISYAHKDSDRIMPILAHLQKEGYRLWFDEGIVPGSEWPENIAQHMNGCAVTVAFISPNSIASPNCRREITYALSKKKPFLSIFLEATEMSPGMELQLSAQQSIMRQNFSSDQLFFDKIATCPDLAPCLEKPPVVVPPVVPTPAPAPVTPKAPAAKTAKNDSPKKAKKKFWIPIVIAAAIVCLIAGIVVNQLGQSDGPEKTDPTGSTNNSTSSSGGPTQPSTEPGTNPTNSTSNPTDPTSNPTGPTNSTSPETSVALYPDMTVELTDTYLSLYERLITVEVAQKINKLSELSDLDLTKCEFASGALEVLTLPKLTYVYITNCTGDPSYHFLANAQDLRILSITNSGVTDSNFPSLSADSLRKVTLSNNPGFTDVKLLSQLSGLETLIADNTGISTLEGLPLDKLYHLNFSYTAVSDISLLSECNYLAHIYGRATGVTDISVLAPMDTLMVLDFSICRLDNITAPFYSFDLEQILLYSCGLTDISGLTHLAELQVADLGYNRLSDVSFLSRSTDTLYEVSVMGNPVTQDNLSFLYDCTGLTLLYLNDIPLTNLDFCRNMPDLQQLRAANCGLSDISGLSGCTELEMVVLGNNNISDISALSGLTNSYITVDLAYNNLRDVSALPNVNYKLLCLAYNDNLDFTTLAVKGSYLIVTNAENLSTKLADNFYDYYVIACPIDQMAEVQKTYGKSSVTFLPDENAFLEFAESIQLYYVF